MKQHDHRRARGMGFGFGLTLVGLMVAACQAKAPQKEVEVKVDDKAKAAMSVLKDARVFFAHHSIGDNLMDGMKKLEEASGSALRFKKTDDVPKEGGVFVDANPGENLKPLSKVDDFVSMLKNHQDGGADVAVMKFCYVDFPRDMKVEELFDYYVKSVEEIKKARPDLTLVHMTAPLMSRPTGWKADLKRMLGRKVWEDETNVYRNAFNKMVTERYKDEPIFDLAKVESTYPDGERELHDDGLGSYYGMVPAYTTDGGHLSESGKIAGAQGFVEVLAKAYQDHAQKKTAAAANAAEAAGEGAQAVEAADGAAEDTAAKPEGDGV